ncbi:RNA polymerase sigma factor [Klugiella xanthotipulae]|uniref:RNA polymerase sigma factor n=1 Tax=Klugiella xanthotipulae TaxID=244735 RepID=UPI00114E8E21|nr:RNA polymerase sigma factor [Klugiella xanthotipulae]
MNTDSDIIRQSEHLPTAFGELYDRHASHLFRYAAGRVGSSAAEDVVGDTFLTAFERRATFDHEWENARPWLFGITTTLIRKHRRMEAQNFRSVASATAFVINDDRVGEVSDRIDAERNIRALTKTLTRMAAADRDTLLLYAWGDLTYEDIALALSVPVGTVRSRLNRARRTLRASLSPEHSAQEVDHGRTHPAPQNA